MSPNETDPRAIVSEALERASGPERAAYLDDSCGDDVALRHRVETLLEAGDRADGFLDPATGEATTDDDLTRAVAPAIAEGPGDVIGPYKLIQEIGEGGMGAVFMAEQEKPVRRRVALEVIKPGMDTRQVLARFEAERQALAMMEHPNIARVLDVGATEAGRPYFVMELVKGVPVTEYCDRNHLTLRERLELFIPVCQAIQHAHQKGVIHRDVKPSNVLVTLVDGRPTPKVIDFGIAKAIDRRLTERTMFTEFGAVIGTLEYMSPEQAEMGALDVDTRTDVYSLGVLLYELLTGSTPLERGRLREAGCVAILKRIREEEPTKPSTRLSDSKDALPSISAQRKVEPARLTRLVRGDLDWIVMRSLEKDRTRRYETANGFARDVQRHLDGDAVEASPPSATYKLRKLARKHRAALATAGAFALLLVAATVLSAGLAYWANEQRLRAEGAESAAEAQKGRAQDREQMAIDAVKRFGDVVRETPELKNSLSLAGLRTTLLKEPEGFFQRLRDRLQADHETTPDSLARLAAASFDLGRLKNEIGDKQEALRDHEEALAVRERLARAGLSSAEFQHDLSLSHDEIGLLQRRMGRPAEALASHERALAILELLVRDNPSVVQFRSDLAASHLHLGTLHRETGRPAEALASHEQAVAIQERLARAHPESPGFASELGGTLNNLASVDLEAKQFKSARARLLPAVEWQSRALAANPLHPGYRLSLVSHLTDLIHANEGLGLAEAAAEARRKLAEVIDGDPTKAAVDARLAAVLAGGAPKEDQRIELAFRAYEKMLYACSARLYIESFEADPGLAEDRQILNRYNAACAAALAASDQGRDVPTDAVAKATLRKQALGWLRAELAAWSTILEADEPDVKSMVAPNLRQWKTDADLASIRDESGLADLPEAERAAFKTLWEDVDRLLSKVAPAEPHSPPM